MFFRNISMNGPRGTRGEYHSPMLPTSAEIRRANLEALVERFGGKLKNLERITEGRLVANQLSQIRNGTRNMGNIVARRIERELGLADGYMDAPHPWGVESGTFQQIPVEASDNTQPAFMVSRVPLISWVQAGAWNAVEDPYSIGDAEEWVPVYDKISDRAFALRVAGDSMTNPFGNPNFPEGSIIVVDPELSVEAGRFVIARLEGDPEATFKQFVRDGGKEMLKPLNPRYPMIPIDRPTRICGIVVAIAQVKLL